MNGKVHNDNTTTARWNPPLAVNPAGTELFVGCSSRQTDRTNNAWIMTYGAKAIITNGLASATFDVIPMSSVAFTNLFAGTTNSSPPTDPWLFDPVWPQGGVCLDASAAVVDCSSPSKVWTTPALYANFCADDYTWAAADSSSFYFAWCDRADTCTVWTNYTRADPNIRLGKIHQ